MPGDVISFDCEILLCRSKKTLKSNIFTISLLVHVYIIICKKYATHFEHFKQHFDSKSCFESNLLLYKTGFR